jgi:hypothetical protein
MNSKNKNIRDLYRSINESERGYQSNSNLMKHENGDLLADSHNIFNRWENYYSQLVTVHSVSDVRQIEIHAATPFVSDHIHFEVEIAIAKLKKKKYKLPGSDQRSTKSLILFGIRKNCLTNGRSLLLYQFTKRQ